MKLKLFFILLLISAGSISNLNAQTGRILIQQFSPPPNQLRVGDLWNVHLTNLTSQKIEVFLRGTVRQDGNIIYSALTSPIELQTGSEIIQGKKLEPIRVENASSNLDRFISHLGAFPDGKYQVCVAVISRISGENLGEDCFEHSVSTALPPILLAPYDGSAVFDDHVIWSWFMQSSLSNGGRVKCDLTVVEILEGQTLEEAIKLNPPVIDRKGLVESAWQTNFAARSFQNGKNYAWRIIAYDGDNPVSQSEIWKFTYNDSNGSLPESNPIPIIKQSLDSNGVGLPSINQVNKDTTQKKDNNLKIAVSSKLIVESSSRKGFLSQTPQRFLRWHIDPTLNIFGVPFGLNLIISTEENTKKSTLNRGAIAFSSNSPALKFNLQQRIEERIEEIQLRKETAINDSLRNFVSLDTASFDSQIEELRNLSHRDPAKDMEAFKSLGLINSSEAALMDFPNIGFGKVAPNFSELLFSSVTVNGALIEYNPQWYYFGGAIGKVQRDISLNDFQIDPNLTDVDNLSNSFFNNVYSFRMGVGKKNATNLIVTWLYSDDDEQSILLQKLIDSTGSRLAPQENYAMGLTGRLMLDSIGLLLEGEFNSSLFTDNTKSGVLLNRNIPSFLINIIGKDKLKSSSAFDYSYAARAKYSMLNNSGTLAAGVRMVGPGYRSVGVYALRTDIFKAELGYEQLFLENQIRISTKYFNEQSGYVLQENRSDINNFAGSLDFRFRDMPYFFINYNYSGQKMMTVANSFFESRSSVGNLQVSSLYNFRSGQELSSTFISFGYQKGKSDDSLAVFDAFTVLLNQRYSLSQALSFAASFSITSTKNNITPNAASVKTFDFSAFINPFRFWSNTIGINTNSAAEREKIGFYLSTQVDLWSIGSLQLYFEQNSFKDSKDKSKDFNESILRLMTTVNF